MFKVEHQTLDTKTDGAMFTPRVNRYEMAHEDLRRPEHGGGRVEIYLAGRRELDDGIQHGGR